MADRELEKRMEQRQAQDEADLALGRRLRLALELSKFCDVIAELEKDKKRLDWLSRPENVDVEFCFCQAGYHVQQAQQVPGTHEFRNVVLNTRDWPTLREALDEAMRAAGIGSLPTLGEKLAQLREEYRVSEGRVYTAEEIAAEREE